MLIPGTAHAAAEHTTVPPDIKVYSNDEYVRIFGVQKAAAEGVPLPSATGRQANGVAYDPPRPWFKVNCTSA
ncbi:MULTISPECIES: hypothetical protein [Streptomyces]|uniref:hypothetical protein n=1 Tax=Streptomyces TaxID=1883 RepID=UPI0002AC9D69|nr:MULTISPECIES: hypothetical protein [Streptomyces]KOG74976.1 hypothetical protein ADK78_13460 [Kitasatospora aureofaciens]KOT41777.1 hypothetical protein ADK84_10490 [Streptomyces sp. NRRL WC-3701]QDA02892.1 hypothetical protein CTZ40_03010 [Streptomyces rimosus]KOT43935.1 hypothetical protein ADK42_06280 [Streptomyces rimosus subsp. rimosus]KOT67271.1 hypothetical protein ADK44_03660 [Streptomyces rimosus subsp. rimosus]